MDHRKRDGEETKRRIAQKAKELFIQKGYMATSMEDITQASESSKGNIYHHFKSKENLFLYLLESSVFDWLEKWDERVKNYPDSITKLYGLAEHVASDFDNPLMKASEEFGGSQLANSEIFQRSLELIRLPLRTYRQVLQEGMEKGEFKPMDLDETVYILSGFLSGLGVAYYEMSLEKLKELHRKAIDIILYGILQHP